MSLSKLGKEILDKARFHAAAMLKDAERESEKINAAAKDSLNASKQKMKQEEEAAVASYRTLALAQAHSSVKRMQLQLDKLLFDEVFDLAKSKLEVLPNRKAHVKKLAGFASATDTVMISKKDAGVLPAATVTDILGGIIIESKDGTQRIDLSYETLIAEVKQKSYAQIASVL